MIIESGRGWFANYLVLRQVCWAFFSVRVVVRGHYWIGIGAFANPTEFDDDKFSF